MRQCQAIVEGWGKLPTVYHKDFWIAVSAAAPVIALAAVVAYPDTDELVQLKRDVWERWRSVVPTPLDALALKDSATYVRLAVRLCLGNIVVQAVTLTFSLLSLASEVDEWPTWMGILGVVGGVSALALCALLAPLARFSLSIVADRAAEAAARAREGAGVTDGQQPRPHDAASGPEPGEDS